MWILQTFIPTKRKYICNNRTHIDYSFVLCDKVERTIRINRIVKKKAGLVRLLNLICSSSPIVRD